MPTIFCFLFFCFSNRVLQKHLCPPIPHKFPALGISYLPKYRACTAVAESSRLGRPHIPHQSTSRKAFADSHSRSPFSCESSLVGTSQTIVSTPMDCCFCFVSLGCPMSMNFWIGGFIFMDGRPRWTYFSIDSHHTGIHPQEHPGKHSFDVSKKCFCPPPPLQTW